ncbi:RNA polymerase sigma factor [Corallococcus exiguus]|uniref:RNA polymerase sigma factor n=1 Tax=Corallococcus TaxID=83461 RepID=UPI0013159DF3|nr:MULTISPECIES: RNA polymerase sigma factor [Corallococcus]NPC48727.1 RNA polymerase sigma factor [Corallococcus exiguus]
MTYRDWLLSQARNLCRNETDAEDLVQETLLRFVKTFSQSGSLPDRKACGAWLNTTLSNLFIDQCRKQQVRKKHLTDPTRKEQTEATSKHSALPDLDDVTPEQLARAVETLSPPMQETYNLHAKGMKYRDIAEALGIPVGTVSKRLHDIRAKLGALLRPHHKVN